MSKSYYSLGLMSGTSMDGVDASIIQSDGESKYKLIIDKYFEYPQNTFKDLIKLRDKIKNSEDLKKFSKEIVEIEREITLFHAKASIEIIKKSKIDIDIIGFHGQTIFHRAKEKISKQLGDGKLLSQMVKKTVAYDFRQNDLDNGGQGAPLTPVFHKLLIEKFKLKLPLIILNIGGIANVTVIDSENHMFSYDIGPGNCLIDNWIRSNSNINYDKDGKIAMLGKVNKIILNKTLENFEDATYPNSYDVKDFDLSFVRGLSLEDGAATLTEYTSEIIFEHFLKIFIEGPKENIILSGGGRKNKFLIKKIEDKIDIPIKLIDEYGVDGDFIESQAFAYIAIRSYLRLPISFPSTTGVKKSCTGGLIVKS